MALFSIPGANPFALGNFCWSRDRSRSVKKPFLFENRVSQRVELNGFSGGGENKTKNSSGDDFLIRFFIGEKMNTKKKGNS
ncbi:MAG: hypothetical protein U5K69_18905 [Balneolaceae bacterium]|nr:hypothetical protein [Balneolaceae bacterium]